MMMVKRWTLSGVDDREWPTPDDGGAFVMYDDYAALEAENASLRARIEAAPHTDACNSHHHCGICSAHWGSVVHDGGHRAWRHKFVPGFCDCWKSAS